MLTVILVCQKNVLIKIMSTFFGSLTLMAKLARESGRTVTLSLGHGSIGGTCSMRAALFRAVDAFLVSVPCGAGDFGLACVEY